MFLDHILISFNFLPAIFILMILSRYEHYTVVQKLVNIVLDNTLFDNCTCLCKLLKTESMVIIVKS